MHSDTKLAYAAGLIDGEGYIGIHSKGRTQNKGPTVQVKMTCERTVRSLHELFGVGSITYYANPGKSVGKTYKPQWRWAIDGKKAQDVLRLIRPFMLTKADDADKVLEFVVASKGKRRIL